MRPIFIAFGLLTLGSGCSKYVTEKELPTGCAEKTYYLDDDEDGWGDAASGSYCAPEGKYTALNQLDCDDKNRLVTGKVGSICPENLVQRDVAVANTKPDAGQIVGGREYVAVIDSVLSGSESAAIACGETGWGGRWGVNVPGGLATFSNMHLMGSTL